MVPVLPAKPTMPEVAVLPTPSLNDEKEAAGAKGVILDGVRFGLGEVPGTDVSA